MILRRNLFIALGLTLLLTACGDKADQSVQFSDAGLIPEAYMPGDVGLVVSYSSRSEEQLKAIQLLESNLGDSGQISEAASEALDTELGSVGLDFERDLKPAFGERFRMVFALRPTDSDPDTSTFITEEDSENFTVITLEDPQKMTEVLTTLSDAGQLTYKKLSDIDVYTATNAEVYMTIHEDLLLVASTPENLVGMTEQDEGESLWKADLYEETLEEVGTDYSMFGVMFPALYSEELSLLAGFSVSGIPSVVDKQVVVIRAEELGLRLDAWMDANKSKAKEADISFDIVPMAEAYLLSEITGEGVLAYFESYGLAQTITQASELGDDAESLEEIKVSVRNYFGMELEDILSFLDKGYAVSLHKNVSSLIPGITLYVDTSSNSDMAEKFMDKVSGQISGLLILAESYLPGALTQDTVTWGGDTFTRLKLDLNSVAQLSGGALPAEVTDYTLELAYGVQSDRLVFTTLTNWDREAASIADTTLFKSLDAQLPDQKEGLSLIDVQAISSYIKDVQAVAGELGPEETEQLKIVTDFLDEFLGMMARSNTEAYESHLGGFLMLAQ